MACFLGSDWCPYCIRLLKESLWTSEFKTWAADNVVVLILDYPEKTPQLPAVKMQNAALKKKYSVKGYPTTVLLSADGNEIGRVGGYSGKDSWPKEIVELAAKAKKKQS